MNRVFLEKLKLVESWRIPFLGGYWVRLLSQWDRKSFDSLSIPSHPLNTAERKEIVICSLTSFPARIQYVHLAIKSLMLQTYKPDRIILWLANEQFPQHQLPKQLTDLEAYGLEIRWCHDLYGHKKYYYPVREQKPNELVITFDDDNLYSPLCIERLIKTHRRFPDCLVCERGQVLTSGVKQVDNPGRWKTISSIGVRKPTYSMNPSPGSGCLIPYQCFGMDALDEEKIRTLAYKNDDLWYMFMCAANGTRMVKTRKYHRIFTTIDGSQTVQMAQENVVGNRNVSVMKGLIAAYPEAYHRIVTDSEQLDYLL